tara:strand:- start:28079 stop:28702 length:624 start_codon:yes stop_codon:yes gene_type:complete
MVLPVSLFSSTQIIVNSLHIPPLQQSIKSVLASSPVLDYLLPELSIWQTGEVRQKQELANLDAYMLEETRLILKRVRSLCSSLALTDSTRFNIKLQASGPNNALLITGAFEEKKQLNKLINEDSWLTGAFDWLCPNYTALAHSQELSSFSYLYEKDRQQALHQYRHFGQTEKGMRCYLACNIEKGEPKLTWRLESPKTVYILKALLS